MLSPDLATARGICVAGCGHRLRWQQPSGVILPTGDMNKAAKERSKNKKLQSAELKRLKTNLAEGATKMRYESTCHNRAAQTFIHYKNGLSTGTKLKI